jgi:hypothetical protein
VADQGLVDQQDDAAPRRDPLPEEMVTTGEAAAVLSVDPRTVVRWLDGGTLAGGRRTDPDTDEPIAGSHRWVDVRHAVARAVREGRAHLIPARWQHLVAPARAAMQHGCPLCGHPGEQAPVTPS